jgi:excisionase family DNA binding protein
MQTIYIFQEGENRQEFVSISELAVYANGLDGDSGLGMYYSAVEDGTKRALTDREWAELEHPFLTTLEAAAILNVSRSRILKLIAANRLQARKRGRDWWVTPESLEAVKMRKPGRPPKVTN